MIGMSLSCPRVSVVRGWIIPRRFGIEGEYGVWCAGRGLTPLSLQKLGAELTRLGYAKWKSCGLIRYPNVQLVA